MNKLGLDSNYTSLYPLIEDQNPGDSLSAVPYEKGYQFLLYLEGILGEANFHAMLKSYLIKNSQLSIDYTDFKEFIESYTRDNLPKELSSKLESVDWETWVKGPGPAPIHFDFTTKLLNESL